MEVALEDFPTGDLKAALLMKMKEQPGFLNEIQKAIESMDEEKKQKLEILEQEWAVDESEDKKSIVQYSHCDYSDPQLLMCIPLRLSEDERELLNILEEALNVSEYTDVIDIFGLTMSGRIRRMSSELQKF